MNSSCILRRYQLGDEQAILGLLNTSIGEAAIGGKEWGDLRFWKWKFQKNPAGSALIWLAESDGKIVGHYALVPVIMKVGNAYVTAAFSADAATHPEYQGQGVFSSIANRLYLDAGQRGIPITYGFARTDLGAIYKRYERTGQICIMVLMVKVLDWEPLLAKHLSNNFLVRVAAAGLGKIRRPRFRRERLTSETIDRFDERFDAFWQQVCGTFKIIVKRDQRYLNWRYVDHPEKQYTVLTAVEDRRILGYCVLTKMPWQSLTLGLIVDMLGLQSRRNVIDCLIDNAVERFKQEGVHGITCMLSERHPYESAFRKAGFIRYPRRNPALHASVNLPGSPIDEKRVYSQALLLSQNTLLKQKSNWFIMYGDGDWDL